MKLLAILLISCCVFASSDAFPERRLERALSDGMAQALEKLRELIYNGNETLGIPILDPLRINAVNIDMDNSLLVGNFKAEDISLTGLGSFDITDVDITVVPTAVKFQGSFPMTTFRAEHYSMFGKLSNILPIYGDGIAHFDVGNFAFVGRAKVAVGISGVSLRDIELDLSMGSFKSQTTGMLGGGDIDDVINAIIEDFVADIFNKHSDAVSDFLGSIILENLNKVLDGMSLADLIDLITGGSK